jgi:hypothetical protein
MMKKTHDYIHYYRGYWSEGGRCRIRIYQGEGKPPVVVCSQLPDNANTPVTNTTEYLAAERSRGASASPASSERSGRRVSKR